MRLACQGNISFLGRVSLCMRGSGVDNRDMDRRHRVLPAGLLLIAVAVGGCGQPASTSTVPPSTSEPQSALSARSLVLPTFGAACRPTSGALILPDVGPGLGPGPVWPVGFGTSGRQGLGTAADGIWHEVKVLWVAAPTYRGPVEIRGRRIDRPGDVRFALGGAPVDVLELPQGGPTAGERTWPSYTLVEEAGCYAYQIDGTGFSTAVEFEITN